MVYAANGTRLFLIIEDRFEWFALRYHTGDGTLEIIIDRDNIDVFFPNFDEYIDPDNAYQTLRFADAIRFQTLEVIFRNGVEEVGEGIYDIDHIEVPNPDTDELDGTLADLINGGLTINIHTTHPSPKYKTISHL